MNLNLKLSTWIAFAILTTLIVGNCAPTAKDGTDVARDTSTPEVIPTWTPRPQDPTALPTATKPALVLSTPSATPVLAETTSIEPTPKTVSVSIVGGNLFVHRGPSLYHNFTGVLYDGEMVLATGRDRISRWIQVELPDQSGKKGWITTETQYTEISGDISNLPFLETEPANPAYIRNCTKSMLWILPEGTQLLDKFNAPYNEEQFVVGRHQVIDPDNPGVILEEVELSEGETVDIIYDAAGEKSKCE